MDSANFQGHWITFGIFYFIFRIRHLGSFSPCYAWRFGLIFYRQAKNSVQMDSANFQGHWMTFGIFYFIFRIRHLGSLPPCCAWNFGLIFCRQANNNVQIKFSEFGPRGIFFRPGHVPGWVLRGLGIFFLRVVGGHPGLGISFGRSTCPVGRSGDSGNFSSVAGHADGP